MGNGNGMLLTREFLFLSTSYKIGSKFPGLRFFSEIAGTSTEWMRSAEELSSGGLNE